MSTAPLNTDEQLEGEADASSSVSTANQTPEVDYDNMSDEDFLNTSPPSEEVQELEVPVDDDLEEQDIDDDEETDEQDGSETDSEEETDEPFETKDEDDSDADTEAPVEDEKAQTDETLDIDYKGFYDAITAPFKANGHDIKLDNADDVIQLMQMGAGFNKKMGSIKPHLKIIKMLQNNDLLDESKLSFAIDLINRKDPSAIQKLVKDSDIDPMGMDSEETPEYQPNTYTVDDSEMKLDEVLDGITSSPAYQDTLDIVGNKWDEASRAEIANDPAIIRDINAQVESGVYAQISQNVERLRMLGKLSGVSDIQAYREVGHALAKQGALGNPAPAARQTGVPQGKPTETTLKNKKRAASTKKSASTKARKPAPDYLDMPDDEFEKLGNPKFM